MVIFHSYVKLPEGKPRFRHYPLRILIGNGGFDEGASDTAPR